MVSGEPGSLRLPAAEEHAGEDAHARSEGRDAGNSLWELQSSVHPEHDTHGGAGEETQVGGDRMHNTTNQYLKKNL